MSDPLHEALRATGVFAGLSDGELARIVEVGRVEYWRAGAVVLEEGSVGPRMMAVIEGRVAIERGSADGRPRSLAELGPGEILGEMSLLLDLPRTATVRAVTDLKVLAMDRSAFEDMADQGDPAILKLSLQLSRGLARRVVALSDRVVGLLQENDELRARFDEARGELFKLWGAVD